MILLLVDDEKYTRDGIRSLIPWQELGVDRVEEADDGSVGYEAAIRLRPDIILTDVLMPKMDGIEMTRSIRNVLHNVSIIFMSAYSDKEYLQSAIELSAVNYIEKPINLDKLKAIIGKTVMNRLADAEQARQVSEMKRMLDTSLPVLRSEIAQHLTRPCPATAISTDQLITAFPWLDTEPDFLTEASFVSVIIGPLRNSSRTATLWLEAHGYHAMMATREDGCLIAHICLIRRDGGTADIEVITAGLAAALGFQPDAEQPQPVRLAAGILVKSLYGIEQSFHAAEEARQRSYYHAYTPVAFAREQAGPVYHFNDLTEGQFRKHLHGGEKQLYLDRLEKLQAELRHHDSTPVASTQAFLGTLAAQIAALASQSGQSTDQAVKPAASDDPGGILRQPSLDEAIDCLKKMANGYFAGAGHNHGGHIVVEEICRYIEENYLDQNLSLGKIAAEIHMSPAHLCVLFKKGQKMTLNQYLTQYRINKAKSMLADLSFRVKDVADGVGFSDCNYFIKVFKKETGFTPMDFREIQYHEIKSKALDHSRL